MGIKLKTALRQYDSREPLVVTEREWTSTPLNLIKAAAAVDWPATKTADAYRDVKTVDIWLEVEGHRISDADLTQLQDPGVPNSFALRLISRFSTPA